MLIEALILFLSFYLFSCASVYIYAVIKSYEVLGFWNWSITENYIGICEYPKWLLGWVYKLKVKLGR